MEYTTPLEGLLIPNMETTFLSESDVLDVVGKIFGANDLASCQGLAGECVESFQPDWGQGLKRLPGFQGGSSRCPRRNLTDGETREIGWRQIRLEE
jgi:hypothetical protein